MFTLTKQHFLETEKQWFIENESIQDYENVLSSLKQEYFEILIKEVKNGKNISIVVFNELDDLEKYYFNKHFNAYNDKIVWTS